MKGPLKCTKRYVHWNVQKGPLLQSIRLINDAVYYIDIDLDTVEDLNKFCYPIS